MRVSNPPNRRVSQEPPEPVSEPPPARISDAQAGSPAPAKRRKKKKKGPGRAALWLQRLSLLTGIIVVVSASVLVAWGLRRYLRSSPRFAIRNVELTGNQRRSQHQILKRAGLAVGDNIFSLDEERAGSNISADPWIEAADVTRDLPNGLHIHVVEREARALATLQGQLYLVDTKGELFKKRAEGDPSDLVVISGLGPQQIVTDREGVTHKVRRVLELIADLEGANVNKRYPLQEVRLEPNDTVVVTVGSDGIELHMGKPPYRQKIAKLTRILGELRHRKVMPAVVFLDNVAHPERVVVRMRGGKK